MSRFGQVKGNARREAWGTSVEIGEGLFRVRLDNSLSQLMINTYVYRGPRELLVIDPGWPWTLDALEQALRDLGLARSFIDVDAWLYTHTHIDHMGPAALLAEFSDAPHYTWSRVEPFVHEWHSFQDRYANWTPWGQEAFLGDEMAAALQARTRLLEKRGELMLAQHGEKSVHNFVGLEFGQRFRMDDLELEFVDARGHDPYHGAFFERSRGWLFSGDVVIATPTPISPPMGDDIELYLQAIDRLEALDASLLLPGHGVQRGGELSLAFGRSRDYQHGYRDHALRLLEESSGPLDLLELGLRSTPNHQAFDAESRWLVHLALFDTHLRKLVADGVVERIDGPRYRLA